MSRLRVLSLGAGVQSTTLRTATPDTAKEAKT
jgi:hypothetical protein